MTESNNLKGIVFMLATCLIITLSTVLIKTLGQNINTFEVVMMRCFVTVMITLILNFQMGKLLFKSAKPGLVSLRSLLTGFVVLTNFYAVSNLPLMEVTSLQLPMPVPNRPHPTKIRQATKAFLWLKPLILKMDVPYPIVVELTWTKGN